MPGEVVGNIPPMHHDWYAIRKAIIEAKMVHGEPLPVDQRPVREIMMDRGEPAKEVIPWQA